MMMMIMMAITSNDTDNTMYWYTHWYWSFGAPKTQSSQDETLGGSWSSAVPSSMLFGLTCSRAFPRFGQNASWGCPDPWSAETAIVMSSAWHNANESSAAQCLSFSSVILVYESCQHRGQCNFILEVTASCCPPLHWWMLHCPLYWGLA